MKKNSTFSIDKGFNQIFKLLSLLMLFASFSQASSASPLCASSPTNFGYEYVSSVSINGQVRQGNTGYSGPGYMDYSGSSITTLVAGNTYPVSVTVVTNSTWQEYVKIWFDFNGNQNLQDPGELIFDQNHSWHGVHTFSGNITVPTTAYNGEVYIRVIMVYAAVPQLCGNYSYGNTIDFKATITGGVTPRTLSVSKAGSYQGNVTSSPSGINTSGGFNSANFADGSNVTLTASNVSGGKFTGWSGDITGSNSTIVVPMNSNRNVVANFAADIPADPTSITATDNLLCLGESTSLSVNGGTGTVYWYSGSCGGTPVGTGNSITVSPTANTTYFARNFNNGHYSTNCATVSIAVSTLDSDGDGVPDDCDLDDDNDGILDTDECTSSNFFWSNPPTISGTTASGTINGIAYTYTSTVNVRQTTNMFAHSTFPSTYNVPNANPTIQNIEPSSNTLTFSSPMTNPVLVFSSIGGGPIVVPINFSNPVEILWSNNTVHQISPTQITGQEGYAIVRMNGTFSSLSFDYLTYENYVNFAFGADFFTFCDTDGDGITDNLDLDSDNDGCYDAIEGSLGLSDQLAPNGRFTGPVDANGVPVVVGSEGQEVGTSINASANCFCELGIDYTNPVAVANNLVVQLDASGAVSISPEMIDNGSTDNCGIVSYLLDKSTFDCSNIGNNIVTLTVSDANGNIASAIATVTVEDNIAPVITCPANILVNNTPSQCGANVNFTASATDNCSSTLTYSHQPNSFFPIGITPVTITATDAAGNLASCTFNVEVVDVELPTISCPFDIVVNADPTACGAVVNYQLPTGNDNCGTEAPPTNIANHTYKGTYNGHTYFLSNGMFPPETAHANALAAGGYLATISDAQENQFISAMHPDRIWIGFTDRDQEGVWRWITDEPVVYTNWAGGEPNNAGGNEDWAVINWSGPTWNDWYYTQPAYYVIEFSSGGIPSNLVAGLPSGSVFPVGTTEVTYEVVDPSGNRVECSFYVTVNDNQAPVAIAQNIVVPLDANGQAVVSTAQVDNGSTDNCGIASLSINKTTFDCSNVGTNNVILTVTDVNGNIATKPAVVTIVDQVAPVVVVQNITVQLDASGSTSITPAQIDNGSTDACGIATIVLSQTTFDCSNVGSNTVTLTVTDVNGNVAAANAVVTVQDIIAPNVIAQDVVVQLDEFGNGYLTPEMVDNGSTDECGIASMTLTRSEFSCTNIGEDIPGVVTAKLTVDNQFWLYISTSPTDEGTLIGFNGNWPEVTTHTANLVPGQTYYLQVKAEDVGGPEMLIGDFNVTGSFQFVNGLQTLSTNAANWTLSETGFGINPQTPIDLGPTNFSPIWGVTPGISSNARYIWKQNWNTVGNEVVYFSTPILFTGVVNETILTVTDVNGNASSQTVNVTVEDNVAPVALAQDITIQLDAAGQASITPEMIDNGSNDACGIASLAVSQADFDCAHVGPNTVTLTVTDVNGNVSTVDAVVTVEDHIAPVALAQDITIQLDAAGQASITPEMIENGSNDACGIASLTVSQADFDCTHVGPNTVTLTVTDVNGNVSTVDAVVTVEDNIAPSLTVPADIVQLNDALVCGALINVGAAITADNCAVATVVNDSPGFFEVGTTTVTWTVTDVNGNQTSATQQVVITNDLPVLDELTVDTNIERGETVTASATFTDNNVLYATFEWGDGSTSNGLINGQSITGDHVYTETGMFTVNLIIEDACGEMTSMTYAYVVIWSPCEGKLTAGGWMNYVPGNWLEQPALSGKAMFEINAQYKKNGELDGKFNFELKNKGSELKLKSTGLDWLMINGNWAVLSGSAKVGNSHGYTFQVSVQDGGNGHHATSPDYIRVVIWNPSGNVIFDNEQGVALDQIPSTQISNGSIQIHKKNSDCNDQFAGPNQGNGDDDDDENGDDDDDQSWNNKFKSCTIYPNPVDDDLNLKFNGFDDDHIYFSISDARGRKYASKVKMNLYGGSGKTKVSPYKLLKGTYVITVQDKDGKNSNSMQFIKK